MRINIKKEKIMKSISEVKSVRTDQEVNELLKKGWVILHAGAVHVDDLGLNAKPIFMMGKERTKAGAK